jgi:predicted SAM-dependent methyltransferase
MTAPEFTARKLDIGCGAPGWQRTPLEEWIHLNIHDAPHVELISDFAQIALPDAWCEEVYIGDIIEHIPAWRYAEVLTEWNRVLRLGGILRGTCPNGDRAMRAYARGEISFQDAKLSLYGWADRPTEQHYTCFDMSTLTALLNKYGFAVTDYTGSPGSVQEPWWLVFRGTKVANL